MLTREEMEARIAQLEAQLAAPKAARAARASATKSYKERMKARKAQFKLDAWRRAHLHTSINRYHC